MTTITGIVHVQVKGAQADLCSFTAEQTQPTQHSISFTFFSSPGQFTQGQTATMTIQ